MNIISINPTHMLNEFHKRLGDERGRGGRLLRKQLHLEEAGELDAILSVERVNRKLLAHELADNIYVCYGTAHAFNIDIDLALYEIHRANMSKVSRFDVRISRTGKVLKPAGFVPADMADATRWPMLDNGVETR